MDVLDLGCRFVVINSDFYHAGIVAGVGIPLLFTTTIFIVICVVGRRSHTLKTGTYTLTIFEMTQQLPLLLCMLCDKTCYFVQLFIIVGNEASDIQNQEIDIKMKENAAYEAPPSRIKMTENEAYNPISIAITDHRSQSLRVLALFV